MSFKFARKYKLKSKSAISGLFENGKRLHVPQMTLIYSLDSVRSDPSFRISFSVPKRKMKRAVDRNRVKRQMRASFQQKIDDLALQLEGKTETYNMMLIYQSHNHTPHNVIDDKIMLLLKRFNERISRDD